MSGLRKAGHRVAVCLGMGILALSVGACYAGGGSSSAEASPPPTWGYPASWVSVRPDATTAADTYEAPGAARVVLLGLTVANPHGKDVCLERLLLRGEGDLWGLKTVRIALDLDRDGKITRKDPKLWTGPFQGTLIDSSDWATTLEPWSTLSIIVDGDLAEGTPEGTTFRVWMDADAGDVIVKGYPDGGAPRGRAESGWRIIGGPATAILGKEIAEVPFPLGPGEDGVPALAARIRVSSVESVDAFRVGLDGFGTGSGWSDVRWDLWIDGDADGAVGDAEDRLVLSDIQIDPDAGPIVHEVQEPIPAGAAVNLLVAANIGPDVPADGGFFGVDLALVGASGVASGDGIPVAGDPVTGGVRIGSGDLVVAVGGEIAVLDPDLGLTLAMPDEPDNTEGLVTADPNGRWAATATPPPRINYPRDPLIILDLKTGRVVAVIPFDGIARTLVPHPAGDRLYMGVENWPNGIFEVTIPEDLGETRIIPIQEPWMTLSDSIVFDLDPTGTTAYVYEDSVGGDCIKIYDTETSIALGTLQGGGEIVSMKTTPDGSRILARRIGGGPFPDQFLRSIPVDGSPYTEVEIDVAGHVPFEFSISSDGSEVYISSLDEVLVYDSTTLTVLEVLTFPADVLSLSGGATQGRIVALTSNRDLFVVDPGQPPRLTVAGIRGGVCTIGVVR